MELLTIKDLKPKLLAIVAEKPTSVNPVDEETEGCLYTDQEWPDLHCLVGELADREDGWEVPDSGCTMGAIEAADVYGWPLTPPAIRYLADVQRAADNDGEPLPWGSLGVLYAINEGMPPFVILMECEEETLYWSNDDGWVDRASATVFTDATVNDPEGTTGREPA